MNEFNSISDKNLDKKTQTTRTSIILILKEGPYLDFELTRLDHIGCERKYSSAITSITSAISSSRAASVSVDPAPLGPDRNDDISNLIFRYLA